MAKLLGVLILAIATQGWAYGETRSLRIAFIEFPPYKYLDESGNAAGPWVALTEQLAQEADYLLEWVYLPIGRVYRGLIRGDVDIWPGLANIPELAGAVLESDVTPLSLSLSAYHLEEYPPVSDIPSLAGEQLIVIGGFSYLGLLDDIFADETTDIAKTPTHRSALQMLKLGRGHYLVDYDQPINELLADNPMPELQRSPLVTVRGAFIISLANDNAETILQDLEQAYRRLGLETLK